MQPQTSAGRSRAQGAPLHRGGEGRARQAMGSRQPHSTWALAGSEQAQGGQPTRQTSPLSSLRGHCSHALLCWCAVTGWSRRRAKEGRVEEKAAPRLGARQRCRRRQRCRILWLAPSPLMRGDDPSRRIEVARTCPRPAAFTPGGETSAPPLPVLSTAGATPCGSILLS